MKYSLAVTCPEPGGTRSNQLWCWVRKQVKEEQSNVVLSQSLNSPRELSGIHFRNVSKQGRTLREQVNTDHDDNYLSREHRFKQRSVIWIRKSERLSGYIGHRRQPRILLLKSSAFSVRSIRRYGRYMYETYMYTHNIDIYTSKYTCMF